MTQQNPFAPAQQPASVGFAIPTAQQQFAPATIPASNSGVDEISFDSDIKIHNLERFPKLKAGEITRIAFLLFDQNTAPRLKMSNYFYDKQANATFLKPKDMNVLAAAVARYGEPKIKFGTIILRYDTDQYGNLLPSGGFNLYAYTFSTDKFPQYKQLHKEWGLAQHDLILTCTEANFQKIQITVARDSLWQAAPEQLRTEIMSRASVLYDKFLNNYMGAHKTDQEIMQLINGAPAQSAGGPVFNPFVQQQQPVVGGNPMVAAVSAQAGVGAGAATFGDLVANSTNQAPIQQPEQQPAQQPAQQPVQQAQPVQQPVQQAQPVAQVHQPEQAQPTQHLVQAIPAQNNNPVIDVQATTVQPAQQAQPGQPVTF